MGSSYHVQQPYVIAALPRPLNPITGRYVVGEVYGTTLGSRKRKRSELAIGIDGEAVNIYEIKSARLVTSYPVPPQTSFSCAPSSIRCRSPSNGVVSRYTYVATEEPSQKITVFKDQDHPSGKAASTTKTRSLGSGARVIYLACPNLTPDLDRTSSVAEHLLAIREDGAVICLDYDSLEIRWQTPPAALQHDLVVSSTTAFRIECVAAALLSDVARGIFAGDVDALGVFGSQQSSAAADASLLVFISSIGEEGRRVRHLHIVARTSTSFSQLSHGPSISQVYLVPISTPSNYGLSKSMYRLDIRAGTLLELSGETLMAYDLATSVPKIAYSMDVPGAESILRVSKSSIMVSTAQACSIYNPQFRSLQSSASLDPASQSLPGSIESINQACTLVTYFPPLELAIAIHDCQLVALHLEAPKSRTNKRRAEGLLIDSIGRGIIQAQQHHATFPREPVTKSAFSRYLPGSIVGDYWDKWTLEVQHVDALLEANDWSAFEALLMNKLGLRTNLPRSNEIDQQYPDHDHQEPRPIHPRADQRWVLYAISRIFTWNSAHPEDTTIPRLLCKLPNSTILDYLVDAGHLTLSNLKSAFRGQVQDLGQMDIVIAEHLIQRLADLDPTMELLTAYMSATTVGSTELLLATRTLMRSLEIVQGPVRPPPKLLTSGTFDDSRQDPGDLGMELDSLEQEIKKTESYLNGDAGARGRGLSIAFAKLGACPRKSTIKTLRHALNSQEILSLVYLLRVELVKGAWTSRYLDPTDYEHDAELDAPPDGIIELLAELLGRCVDALGPSGWLFNDALDANEGEEFGDLVASLKLEVSAALEGVEEAVYLRGLVGEAVKFSKATWSDKRKAADNSSRVPLVINFQESGDEALPLGLKTGRRIEKHKVISGGEVIQRSMRETGDLKSRQVGPYSLERIKI